VLAPDVLLLDEPTNHLDVAAIEWLEQMLLSFSGSVLFVTHDRRFLDNVATRIIELDRGRLSSYEGNFSAYQQEKAAALETEAVHNRKFDKFGAREVWIPGIESAPEPATKAGCSAWGAALEPARGGTRRQGSSGGG
jgi:ATP-binding cassette subfamily F protein uup